MKNVIIVLLMPKWEQLGKNVMFSSRKLRYTELYLSNKLFYIPI